MKSFSLYLMNFYLIVGLPLLPAKSIHPKEIGKLEKHAGKFRRPVTEWE